MHSYNSSWKEWQLNEEGWLPADLKRRGVILLLLMLIRFWSFRVQPKCFIRYTTIFCRICTLHHTHCSFPTTFWLIAGWWRRSVAWLPIPRRRTSDSYCHSQLRQRYRQPLLSWVLVNFLTWRQNSDLNKGPAWFIEKFTYSILFIP